MLASRSIPHPPHDFYLQWQTTWDRSKLFSAVQLSSPITFVAPGPAGNADIVIDDTAEYQTILGFGSTLSNPSLLPFLMNILLIPRTADSSALVLNNLKVR